MLYKSSKPAATLSPMQMKRRVLTIATLAALIASACGGGSSLDEAAEAIYSGSCADDNGQTVTVYSGRTEALIKPVLDAFACETGTKVDVRWGDSTELALTINTEGDRTSADVYLSRSPGPVGFLEANGHLGTISDEVLSLVAPNNRSATNTWVGFSGRKRVLVYNIDTVSADELPNSVFELTDPNYKGRVALPATNGSFVDWFTVFRDQYGDDVATQWLNDMVANDATFYPNNRAIVEAASRGEIDMGLVNHYYNYQEAAAAGDDHRAANHDFDDDDIGSLLIITAAAITATSDNVEAAENLLTYMLSEPVQQYFSNETFEYPLAAGVAPADILPPLDLDSSGSGSVSYDDLGGGFEQTTAIIEASGILNQ